MTYYIQKRVCIPSFRFYTIHFYPKISFTAIFKSCVAYCFKIPVVNYKKLRVLNNYSQNGDHKTTFQNMFLNLLRIILSPLYCFINLKFVYRKIAKNKLIPLFDKIRVQSAEIAMRNRSKIHMKQSQIIGFNLSGTLKYLWFLQGQRVTLLFIIQFFKN